MPKGTYGHLIAPSGARIVKSVETVCALYDLDGFVQRDGYVVPEHAMAASEVIWDTAEPVTEDGEPVYQDENGHEWLPSQCTFVPEDD